MENNYHLTASIRWADIDANFHLRHTVFYDLGSELRIKMLAAAGVTMGYMQEHGFGPVLFREECRFLREVRIEDRLEVELRIRGLSRDHRKFAFEHTFKRGVETCAVLVVEGAWFSAVTRKLVVPPKLLISAMDNVPRSADFTWIESSTKTDPDQPGSGITGWPK